MIMVQRKIHPPIWTSVKFENFSFRHGFSSSRPVHLLHPLVTPVLFRFIFLFNSVKYSSLKSLIETLKNKKERPSSTDRTDWITF